MNEPVKRLFEIVIIQEGDKYTACLQSKTDDHRRVEQSTSMRTLMAQVTKVVRAKTAQIKKFPLPEKAPPPPPPEPSRIILPGQTSENGNQIRLLR